MVKTANQSLKFADAKVNETACMEDTWEFAKDRDGQSQSSEYINLATVSGTVTAKDGGAALKGATVRFGSKSAKQMITELIRSKMLKWELIQLRQVVRDTKQ